MKDYLKKIGYFTIICGVIAAFGLAYFNGRSVYADFRGDITYERDWLITIIWFAGMLLASCIEAAIYFALYEIIDKIDNLEYEHRDIKKQIEGLKTTEVASPNPNVKTAPVIPQRETISTIKQPERKISYKKNIKINQTSDTTASGFYVDQLIVEDSEAFLHIHAQKCPGSLKISCTITTVFDEEIEVKECDALGFSHVNLDNYISKPIALNLDRNVLEKIKDIRVIVLKGVIDEKLIDFSNTVIVDPELLNLHSELNSIMSPAEMENLESAQDIYDYIKTLDQFNSKPWGHVLTEIHSTANAEKRFGSNKKDIVIRQYTKFLEAFENYKGSETLAVTANGRVICPFCGGSVSKESSDCYFCGFKF